MTTEQHLEYASDIGEDTIKLINQYLTISDGERWNRMIFHGPGDIYYEARLALHHALKAQECQGCNGRGILKTFSNYFCKMCSGYGWIARK